MDGAEADEAAATALNGDAAGHVAAAAHAAGAFTVHVSSDYVFDGTASEPYVESSPTAPLGAYGRSKLAGEHAVAAAAPGAAPAIVRTAWLFGAHGPNFVATMLRLAGERDALSVVDDQVGCPTFTGHLAPALVALAEARDPGRPPRGGRRLGLLVRPRGRGVRRARRRRRARPRRTADLGRPAPRPAYSVLRTERPATPVLPPWQEGLHAYLEETVIA